MIPKREIGQLLLIILDTVTQEKEKKKVLGRYSVGEILEPGKFLEKRQGD